MSAANEKCEVILDDGSDISRAKKLAAEADAVIFVVGYNYDDEGEFVSENEVDNYIGSTGGDRKTSLGLHEDEIELIKGSVRKMKKYGCPHWRQYDHDDGMV